MTQIGCVTDLNEKFFSLNISITSSHQFAISTAALLALTLWERHVLRLEAGEPAMPLRKAG
jgi:hypothetical protein